MPISTTEAFTTHQIMCQDGVAILPQPLVSVAAREAGYYIPTPTINDAVQSTSHPGQMTEEEFNNFCTTQQSSFISAEEMARAIVISSPTHIFTRGLLEELIKRGGSSTSTLTVDEIDVLFATLDNEHKGSITAEQIMRSFYGEDGVQCLARIRKEEVQEVLARKAREEQEAREKAEQERLQREREERERAEREKAEREKAERELAEKKQRDQEAAKKQQKASGCC